MARTGFTVLKSSPWPIYVSLGVLGVVSSFICAIHGGMVYYSLLSALFSWGFLMGSLFGWWMDMIYEGNFKGHYTSRVKQNLWWGFIMFVVSEVFFFGSFFASWYYYGVGEKSQVLLGSWPPVGISAMDPWKIPSVNTILLLSSGVSVTWCTKCVECMSKFSPNNYNFFLFKEQLGMDVMKYSGVEKNYIQSVFKEKKSLMGKYFVSKDSLNSLRTQALVSMFLSLGLGSIFMYLQSLEYRWASLCISDSTFGGCFFILTGFHGMHVILGICFLSVCLVRIYYNHFSYRRSYVGLKCAVLYWHFVDVVWIGVFISVYLWPYFF
uniref:Cytochrome c oxidase subunit 3 n=1 Tax=Paphia euglypta TaxID=345428 RepID=E2DYW8_9BIVA|nr:cytochrome c oxidase subunit III [Paphia euglypta]ADB03057.1 cytochrome c oxidase subunit III [Paphia euglypta]